MTFEEKKLYKYRVVNEYTLNLLKDAELYYSFPHQFNDPFDFFINSDYWGDKNDWKNYINRLNISAKEKSEIYEFAKSLKFDKNEIKKKIPNLLRDNFNDTILIYCFSSIFDSILMWSHYAKNHTGICLGFKTMLLSIEDKPEKEVHVLDMDEIVIKDPFEGEIKQAPLWKVKYSDDFPKLYNGLKEAPNGTFRFIETKSKCWEYEDEYRSILIYDDIKKNNIRFKREILSEVVLGMKISKRDEETIRYLIKEFYIKRGANVKLKRALQVQDKYKLNIEEITL